MEIKPGTKVQTNLGEGIYKGQVELEDAVDYFGMRKGAIRKWDEVEINGETVRFLIGEISPIASTTGRKLSECI